MVESGTVRCVETATGSLWLHQCTTSMAPEASAEPFNKLVQQDGFVSLQMVPVKSVSPVDLPNKLRTAVADSSVSPVPQIRTDTTEMFEECWEYVSMIWLVVEISRFRKLCNGFGLSLSLEPGIRVDFDFVVGK